MLDTWVDKIICGVLVLSVVACIPLIAWAVHLDRQEHQRWEAFKVAHDCKVTARIDGAAMPTVAIDTSGKTVIGMTTTPSKTGWTCDDGVTYYK